MEQKNRFISASYQLYTVVDDQRELEEQTSPEHPFEFISGFGIALDAFEQHIIGLEPGTTFDFILQPEEAFGPYNPEGVHKVERQMFEVNGKFDNENVREGAIITLVDTEQNHFMAKVIKVEADGVTIDTNHPLAGKVLNFAGLVRQNREATEAEITQTIKMLTGDASCAGSCEGCESEKVHHEHGGCGHCRH